jgi:hypothetical protein
VAPHCPIETTCTILEDGSVCERPRNENEFCRVFELDGRSTDDCESSSWCDDSIPTPACRDIAGAGDPCTLDRQCTSFVCAAESAQCGPLADDHELREQELRASCPVMFPTARPREDGG